MQRQILEELKNSGCVCVLYLRGDRTGTTCVIKNIDSWHIQVDEYVYGSMEFWSQSVIAIADISKLDYHHKGAITNAQKIGLYEPGVAVI